MTFGNGMVAKEPIVDLNEQDRRLVWSVVGGRMTHHNGSVQVFPHGNHESRIVWIADLLPNDLKDQISGMMEQGIGVMKQTLDRQAAGG